MLNILHTKYTLRDCNYAIIQKWLLWALHKLRHVHKHSFLSRKLIHTWMRLVSLCGKIRTIYGEIKGETYWMHTVGSFVWLLAFIPLFVLYNCNSYGIENVSKILCHANWLKTIKHLNICCWNINKPPSIKIHKWCTAKHRISFNVWNLYFQKCLPRLMLNGVPMTIRSSTL